MIAQRQYRSPHPGYNKRHWLMGKIHDVAKRLGMPDPQRRDFMMQLVGENSCRDMSERQLVQVLQALQGNEGRATVNAAGKPMAAIGSLVQDAVGKVYRLHGRSGRDERQPDEPLTVEQNRAIIALFEDIEVMNPGRLARTWRAAFCRRTCGHVWPQSRLEGNKIYEALKSMRARGWRPKPALSAAEGEKAR